MIEIDGDHLRIEDVIAVARNFEKVRIKADAKKKIEESRKIVEKIIEEERTVYGVSTGFGDLVKVRINIKDVDVLQQNLVRSHSCGHGKLLPTDLVRAMMLLRANSLVKGYSGVRYELVELLVGMLNNGIHPCIPESGSVGASGDLIPLAHIALAVIGEGEVEVDGEIVGADEGLKRKGLKPIKLKAKEGLALINGTQLMNAYLCFAIHDIHNLLKNAQIAGIMSLEALKGTNQAFREDIQKLRPHDGQKKSAENLWNLLRGSEILKSHRNCPKVQDPYTLRCMPQVFGAVYDALDFARKIAEVEMNSVTDNPMILRESGDVVSGGNFHGQNLAMALDFLSIATSYLGSFSERRIARLVDGKLSELPPFLTDKGGLHSGFMMPHYLAASLVNENKILSHPASVDTIPVSANQEDFVSMGANAGKKLMKIIDNVQTIVAIEYLASAQALEFLKPLKPSRAIQIAYNHIRKRIQKLDVDRAMYRDIEMMKNMVKSGEIVRAVEKEVKLH